MAWITFIRLLNLEFKVLSFLAVKGSNFIRLSEMKSKTKQKLKQIVSNYQIVTFVVLRKAFH